MSHASRTYRICVLAILAALLTTVTLSAGYKVRPWKFRAKEDYPARLTSEGLTIAAEPLFLDALAGQVFDKNDIVTRGIMPLGVVIFNDNGFPVRLKGDSIELIQGGEHIHSLSPGEAVHQIFKGGRNILSTPGSIPNLAPNPDALVDFEHKWLEGREVGAHQSGGGFLYIRLPSDSVRLYLSESRLYIPEIYREDNGQKLMFFEIDLKPAIDAIPDR